MSEKLGLDSEIRELKLGKSFDKTRPVAYHSFRYDFKPASVDTSQVASVDIGEGHSVTVTVPHVEGAGTSHTVYKGNKRPCQKECVLVIDHQTGEITLEKLATNIHLKKTRQEGSSRAGLSQQRPHTPTEKVKDLKSSPPKKKKSSPPRPGLSASQGSGVADSQQAPPRIIEPPVKPCPPDELMSSSSSSSDSESDDDSPPKALPGSVAPAPSGANKGDYHSMLSMDLQLSESDSDSD